MKQAHLKLFLSLILASLATAQYSLGDLSGRLAGGSSYGSYAAPAAPAAPAYSAPAAPAAPAYSAPAAPVPSSYSAPAAPVVSYAPKAIASSGYATTAYTKPASSYGTSGGSYGTSGGSYGTSGGSYGGSSGSYGYQPTGQPYGIQSTGDYSSYNYQQEPLDISKCGPPPTSNPCTAYGPQYYPLPGNPYCYIQCAFERLFVKPCPANLVWNPRITGCDWPTVASYGGDSYGSGASYGSGSSYGASSAAPAKDTSSYSYGRKRRTVERKKRQLVPVPPIPLGAPFLPFGIPGPVPFGGPLGFPGLPGPLGIPTPFYFPYRRPEYKYSYNDDYDYDYDDKDYGKGYGKKDKKYGKKQSSYYDDDDYSYKTKNYYDDDDDYSYKKDKYYDNDYDNGYSKKDKYGKKDKYDNDYNKKDKYNNDYYKKDKYDNDYNKKDKYDNDYNKKDKYNNDYYKKDKYNNKNNYYDDDDDDYDGYYKKDNDYYDDNKGYSKNSKYTFNGNFRPSYSDGYSKNRYDDYNYRDDDYYNDDYNYRKKRQYGYQSETEVKVLPALTSVPQVSLEVVSLCAGKINGENIPHPTDPSKYIACLSSDTQEIMDCPSGLIYDAALDRCEEIKKTELLCESQPCLNDGKCHQTGPTTFQCTCLNGWTGDRCETPLSSCASNPCGLGNSCHSLKTKDYPQDYVCLCNNRQGYGLNCERDTVPNPCLSTAGSFDQYHPFAFSSHAFIQCNGDLLYVQPCAAGLTWDQETKVCDIPVSATTSVPVPMPLVEKSIAYEVASGTEMKQPNILPTISFDEKPAVVSNGYGSTEEKFLVKSKEEPKSSYGSYSGRTLRVKEAPAAYSTFFNPMPTLPSARIIKPKIIGPTEFLPTSHSRTFTPVFTQPNYGQAMPQKFRELNQKEKFFQRTEQYGEDLPAQPFPPTPAPVPRTFPSEAYATSINSYAQPQPERVFVPQLPKVLPKPLVQPETLRTSYGSTSGGY